MNIKRLLFCLVVMAGCAFVSSAQKFALVDMEYVLSNIPSYEVGNKNLEQMSQRWQKEVEAVSLEAETMYKNYQAQLPMLSDAQKKAKEAEIVAKEKEAAQLRNKYFGPEGELFQRRQQMMRPIQEEIYNAVKQISEEHGYMCIFDRASAGGIIFASPRIDVSNEVLAKLGIVR